MSPNRGLLYYNRAMKYIVSKKRIVAAVLAAAIVLTMAACGQATTTVVQRKVETNRGTGFHSTLQ